jgi:glucosyl-3-phosphoglycerate synthase
MPAAAVRTYHHRDFDLRRLLAAKGSRRVSVCLPARDEQATIGRIVASIRRELMGDRPLVDEVLVVDDHSTDETVRVAREAGARVVRSDDVLPEQGEGAGKGDALWKSLYEAEGDVIAWCDADVRNFGPRFVLGLLGPLLTSDEIGFVKGFYERPLDGQPGQGGRVTELVARPLVSLLFPHLSAVVQPLGGEYAGRRRVLEQVPFVQGYGVDLALLIDVTARFGMTTLAQVDLGTRIHRNRPLDELGVQAMAIIQTALLRAGIPLQADWSPVLVRPGAEPVAVDVRERPPLVDVPSYRKTA